MSLWSKIIGTIEDRFQLGLGGPLLKDSSGAVDARNSADSGYAIVRGATPIGDNDLTTKMYVGTVAAPTIVTGEWDGAVALTNNTVTRRYYVVSTTGGVAAIGELIWDNGLNDGLPLTIIPAAARMIVTTVALTGGTVTFKADSPYVWDTDGVSWIAAGPSGVSGAIRELRMPIALAATQASTAKIPANAVVTEATLDIVTPYDAGTTITVGRTLSLALLQSTSDNLATVAGIYQSMQDTDWGVTEIEVTVTVGGVIPAAGAGFCIVKYTMPDA